MCAKIISLTCRAAGILIVLFFASLPSVCCSSPASPFGVFCDGETKNGRPAIDSAVELGIGHARLILRWDMVEPSPGRYNFSIPDRVIELHDKAGIKLLVTIETLSPWATRTQVKHMRSYAASPPKDMKQYEAFIEKTVSRYRGKVKYWQIGNEVFDNRLLPVTWYGWDGTREEYIDLLEHSCNAIKKADPEAKTVLAGFAHEIFTKILRNEPPGIASRKDTVDFFRYVLERGNRYVDLVDFHQYRRPEDTYSMVKLLKETMKELGFQKDIISTEAGDIDIRLFADYFTNPSRSVDYVTCLMKMPEVQKRIRQISQGGVRHHEYIAFAQFLARNRNTRPVVEKYQAEYIVKRMAISLSQGVKAVYSVSIRDNTQPIDWYWAIMSLCDTSGRKKPHYYTYKMLIERLENFTGAEEIKMKDKVKVIRFTFADRTPVLVLWTKEGQEAIDVSALLSKSVATVTHIITEEGKTDKDAIVEKAPSRAVTVGTTPVFAE